MNIQFILSDTTSGATSGALNDVILKAESDVFSDVLVLVPETKSIAIERELLDKSKNGAFANIYIYSFVRLLSRIGGVNESELISKQTAVMLLRNLILENQERLVCYKKTAKTIGFAEKIYETIQQFKSSSYSLEDVKLLAESAQGSLKAKMQDIALLFELFEQELAKGFLDDCDRLRKLGELAKTNEFIKNANVYVVGFDNVTSDMIEVLKQFAISSKSITFACVYFNENRKDKYIQDNELYRKYRSIAETLKFPYNPRVVKSNYSGDFWNIQNYIYSTENKQLESKGNVHIFELDSKVKEFDCLANLILTEIKNGKRFKDIAVIDADFEKDIDEISRVFDEYSIPYFISKSYDISEHFLVRFIKNTIEVILSRFNAEKVLNWLSNPILGLDNYADFETYVIAKGVNYSEFFDHTTDDVVGCKATEINKIISLICEFNEKYVEKFSSANSINHFIACIYDLLEMFNVRERLDYLAKIEKENQLDIDAEISNVILDKINLINENMSKFLGSRVVNPQEFLQIYMSGFSESEVNLVPVSVDCVFIQKNADGLYNIKDLFIINAVEGVFPVKMADTGMLQDSELISLSEITKKSIEPTIKELNKREKFLCYELLLLPKDKLFVLYSTHSYSAVNKPAGIVNRLKNLCNLEVKNECKINKLITQKNAERQFAKKLGDYLSGEMISLAEINREYNKLKNHFSEGFGAYISNLSFGEKEFKIQGAQEIYFAGNKTSVSQLERYFACPYSFFARYGLRLKENQNAKLSSLDIGTLIHKFAELFTKNIKAFEDMKALDFDRKALDIFEKSLDILNINKTKNRALLKFIADESMRLARYLFDEQSKSSFKNNSKLNEFEFSGNNAVKLEIDKDTVISIEGKIDRIDQFGDYVRIIDYKTGETDSNLNSIYYGKKIQLVSYLMATQKIGDKKIAGLFYLPIHSDFVKIQQKIKNNYKMQGFLLDDIEVVKYMDSELSLDNPESNVIPLKIKANKETRETGELQISYGRTKNCLSEEKFEKVKSYTHDLCKQAIAEVLDGNIEPAPFAKGNEKESIECKYCELAGFCGREYAKFGKARRCSANVTEMSFDKNEGV